MPRLMTRRDSVRGVFFAAVLAIAGSYSTSVWSTPACNVQSITAIAPKGTTIESAASTAKPVPHCLIDGYLITTNPGPNKVSFRLPVSTIALATSAWRDSLARSSTIHA